MTIAELNRKLKSLQNIKKAAAQEQAAHNYILASLIGRNIACYFAEDIEIPKLEEVYPSLFTEEAANTKEKQEELKAELSAIRFRQFAESFNKSFKK